MFKALSGAVDRVERVDTTFATLDNFRMRNVLVEGNTFTAVTQVSANPVMVQHDQATEALIWTIDAGAYLPFGGWARNVDSVVAEGMITGPAGERRSDMPFVDVEQGASKQQVALNWQNSSKGRVQIRLRMDNPN